MLRLISRLANLTIFSFLCALIYTNLAIADPASTSEGNKVDMGVWGTEENQDSTEGNKVDMGVWGTEENQDSTTMESLKGTGSTGSFSYEEDQEKKGDIGDGVKNQKSENFERDGGGSGLGGLFFIISIVSFLLFIMVLLRDFFREDPLIKQKKSKEDLKKYGLWLINLKNRMEELFPDKNLDEVNSMEAEFLKKHSMLCEQVDFAHTQPVIDISPQKTISKNKDYEF